MIVFCGSKDRKLDPSLRNKWDFWYCQRHDGHRIVVQYPAMVDGCADCEDAMRLNQTEAPQHWGSYKTHKQHLRELLAAIQAKAEQVW